MKLIRWILATAGILLLLLSFSQIKAAERGLNITKIAGSIPPVTVFAPSSISPDSRPVVLIGHGFAGSSVVMRGFALTLAHAGYTVVTWDFSGHGANPRPLPRNSFSDKNALLRDAEQALQIAVSNNLANPDKVAILGHSMGSGVALAYGQFHPHTAATIAVSPVGVSVTPGLPKNLLLMAGTAESSFLNTGQNQLAQAGGIGGDPKLGTGRRLVPIPGANHVTILFSNLAFRTAREWLDATFGVQPGGDAYTDTRVLWYFAGVLGALLAGAVLVSGAAFPQPAIVHRPLRRRLSALLLGVILATLALWLAGRAGLDLTGAFGLLVGGYLLIWFFLAGLISLALMGARLEKLTLRPILWGLFTFAVLWVGVGLLGSLVWEPWLLIPQRLVYWPLAALLMLPWFLAMSQALRGAGWLGQAGWWLAQSLLVAGGMLLAMLFTPGIGFIILILPVFPLVFAVHAFASLPHRGGWSYAISGALFVSWMLLVVFPLG